MAARDPVEDPDYLFRDLGGSSGDDDDENLFLARRIREIADGIQLFSQAVASLEADLDALRRDVASLRPRQQASPPLWLFFAAVGLALTAWIMTPEDPYAAALAS